MSDLFTGAGGATVFRNESVLSPEYLPDQFPHRENQIQEVANCIKPALSGGKPYNCFIFGPPGVGKTAVVNFVFKELSEFERVTPIYVNCWEYNTRHAVLSKLLNEMGGIAPRRGVATDEVFDRFLRQLRQTTPIIALDEVDQLIRRDGSQLLYDLVRAREQQKNSNLSVIAISNDLFIMRNIDARVKSSLGQEEISFKPYSERELEDIIKERLDIAFRKGFYEPAIISLTAKEAAMRGGDVRFALECLWKAGREADKDGSKVKASHMKTVFGKTGDLHVEEMIRSLSGHERLILRTIAKYPDAISGEIFTKYSLLTKEPVADRTFRNYISRLETLNLIETRPTGEGMKGQSRIISLKISPETVIRSSK
ncbi:MAG: AAA family ATPase [archaeon]